MNERAFGRFGGFGLLAAAAMIATTAAEPVARSQAEAGEGRKRNRGRTSNFTPVSSPMTTKRQSESLQRMLRNARRTKR